jgi:periplasmic divalent cation tolerance protein
MQQSEYIIVMSTVPNDEVRKGIALALLKKKLVPCVNIVANVRSIYTWKGKINDESELILIMKTRASLFDQVRDEVKSNHPYECPDIVALPIIAGYQPYLDWIAGNTKT